MPDPVVHFLSDEDKELGRIMADKRNVNESHFGAMVYDSQSGFDSWETHYIGALGELAVAREYDVEPDLVFLEKGGSNPWDLVIGDLKVDVKTGRLYDAAITHQQRRPQHLYINCKKHRSTVDAYIRCAFDPLLYWVYLIGWADDEHLRAGPTVEGYNGMCFRVMEDDLYECNPRSREGNGRKVL